MILNKNLFCIMMNLLHGIMMPRSRSDEKMSVHRQTPWASYYYCNSLQAQEERDLIRQQRIVEEFMELVRIDSETKHEQEINRVLKHKFSELGLSVVEDDTMLITGHGAG